MPLPCHKLAPRCVTQWACLLSLIVAVFMLLSTGLVFAESGTSKPNGLLTQHNAVDRLHVSSDKMIAEQDAAVVEFIGNVKATQNDSTLLADAVKVFFDTSASKKQDGRRVTKLVATGNVEYTAGDRQAVADKAVYTTADEVLVLTGKAPKLLTGSSWISGKTITLFRLDGRVMVESGGTKRVQAFFDAQDQNRLEDVQHN